MNETQWLASTDPAAMFRLVRERGLATEGKRQRDMGRETRSVGGSDSKIAARLARRGRVLGGGDAPANAYDA